MNKGILKRNDSFEEAEVLPESSSKHVKWDEEKLKESEAIKMTIPKGQIDEPKTPFQHGQYGSSCDELGDDDTFNLKSGDETEEGSLSDSSFRRTSINSTGWESSVSEFETDVDVDSFEEQNKEPSEAFKSLRAQHYFMKQALQRGKELIETDDDDDDENDEEDFRDNFGN